MSPEHIRFRAPEQPPARYFVFSKRLAALLCSVALLARFGVSQPLRPAPGNSQSMEYQVKAAYLLNFTKFIEWPTKEGHPSDAPFTICILGEDPFGQAIDAIIEGEAVNERKLTVKRIGGGSPNQCDLVYAGKPDRNKELLHGIEPGILTVGEGEAFLRDGGMIAFVLENRRVRFSISVGAIRAGKLTVSSRLLSVAKAVEK